MSNKCCITRRIPPYLQLVSEFPSYQKVSRIVVSITLPQSHMSPAFAKHSAVRKKLKPILQLLLSQNFDCFVVFQSQCSNKKKHLKFNIFSNLPVIVAPLTDEKVYLQYYLKQFEVNETFFILYDFFES